MRTKFDSSIARTPEVTSGVTSLFVSDLEGTDSRHPSNPKRQRVAQDLIDAGIVRVLGPNEIPPTVRESVQDVARDAQPTRISEGSFLVGRQEPASRKSRPGLSLVQ